MNIAGASRITVLVSMLFALTTSSLHGQTSRASRSNPTKLFQDPAVTALVNGVPFSFGPEAYALYKKDRKPFEFLSAMTRRYAPLLPKDSLTTIFVGYPEKIGSEHIGSSAGLDGIIIISYEDLTFPANRSSALRMRHLMEVFLHELGHKAFHGQSMDAQEFVGDIYATAFLEKKWGKERHNLFFNLFWDNNYKAVHDEGGHPWDGDGELFASAFMLTLLHPQELESAIARSPKDVHALAGRLYRFMQSITQKFPEPHPLLTATIKKQKPPR